MIHASAPTISSRRLLALLLRSTIPGSLVFSWCMLIIAQITFESPFTAYLWCVYAFLLYVVSYGAHELGHYFTALKLGAQPKFLISASHELLVGSKPHKSIDGLLISAAGPIFGIIVLILFGYVASGILNGYLPYLVPGLIGVGHAANLLPFTPDGNNIFTNLRRIFA